MQLKYALFTTKVSEDLLRYIFLLSLTLTCINMTIEKKEGKKKEKKREDSKIGRARTVK